LAEQVSDPLLTCEAVLAEAAFQVGNCGLVLNLVQEGLLLPDFDVLEHVSQLKEMSKRYDGCNPGLAGILLFCLSELNPRHSVITVDVEDFRIYRRNRRELIPLICPK